MRAQTRSLDRCVLENTRERRARVSIALFLNYIIICHVSCLTKKCNNKTSSRISDKDGCYFAPCENGGGCINTVTLCFYREKTMKTPDTFLWFTCASSIEIYLNSLLLLFPTTSGEYKCACEPSLTSIVEVRIYFFFIAPEPFREPILPVLTATPLHYWWDR